MIACDQRVLSPGKKKRILERDDHCCMYCYGPADQVDHIKPWCFEHDDTEENLVACCWLCNIMAGGRVFETFGRKRDYILYKRERYINKNPIPLWTRSETAKLTGWLKSYVIKNAVVLDSYEELMRVHDKLVHEGWKVIIGNKYLDRKAGITR